MHALEETTDTPTPAWQPPPTAVRLQDNEIHVWCAPLRGFRGELPRLYSTLDAEERARAGRFRFAGDRDDFIACRGILRRLLGQYTHRKPSTIEFAYGRHGKPELAAPGIDGPLHFNASHSGALALYAVTAACPVGVDIELVRTIPNVEDLAVRFLAASEARGVMALPRIRRIEKFFACWTVKEAYLKATGEGIGSRLSAELPAGWHVHPVWPAAGYVGSIVYTHDAARLVCWQVP